MKENPTGSWTLRMRRHRERRAAAAPRVVAPAGTRRDVVTRLNTLINEGLVVGEVTAALAKLHALPKTGTPADFAPFLAAEMGAGGEASGGDG
jgi:hypothetical protein